MEKSIQDFKEVFEGALNEKKLRDSINEEVKKFKEQKSILVQELEKSTAELEKLKIQIGKFSNYEALKKQLNALEYKLHTEGYRPAREKEISAQMNDIEKKIKSIMPEKSEGSIEELKKKIREFDSKIKKISKDVEIKANESEKHHKKMIEFYQKSEDLRKKISSQVQNQQPKQEKHEKQEKTTKKQSNSSIKAKAQQLLEDFKKGKKLSFEELQIIQEASA